MRQLILIAAFGLGLGISTAHARAGERTFTGAAIGAGTGALLGGPVGAVAGGVIGGIVGGPKFPRGYQECWRNRRGERFCQWR